MIVIFPFWMEKYLGNVMAITIYPFIFIKHKYKDDEVTLNHERIHLRQMKEMLVIPFIIVYIINYLVNLLIYKDSDLAYENIIFEREAYQNETDLNYLNKPK